MIYPVIKVTVEDLEHIDFFDINPAIYEIYLQNVKYEFLINCKQDCDEAVIFGTGDVNREKTPLPVFNRNSWGDKVNATCIYYADPSLYLSDSAHLCWCYGTNENWYLEKIAYLLNAILKKLDISSKSVLMFGSSGGGTTSIQLAILMQTKVIAINPQLFLLQFWPSHVNSLKETCLKEDENFIEERVSILQLIKNTHYMPPIRIIQNITADNDIRTQLIPFIRGLTDLKLPLEFYNNLVIDFYYDKKGHSGMPTFEKCLEYIDRSLRR